MFGNWFTNNFHSGFGGLMVLFLIVWGCQPDSSTVKQEGFYMVADSTASSLSIFKKGVAKPILVQNAKPGMRPFLHPIMSPDGSGSLTQYSPGHHKHQTGLYWGFTRVNGTGAPMDTINNWFYKPNKPNHIKQQIGRDYFHNNGESHWRRLSATILVEEGDELQWQTVYHLLDADANPIMQETQTWTFSQEGDKYLISLEWSGNALKDLVINEFSYGGMFLRMPWQEGIDGEVVNAARQRNEKAEGQRAMWVDVGMEIEGRDDWGHIAIFDHPQNAGFPTPWRVDGQLGVGPTRVISGDWKIKEGYTEIVKHRLVAYTGELDDVEMRKLWDQYIGSNSIYSAAVLWTIAQQEGSRRNFLPLNEQWKP